MRFDDVILWRREARRQARHPQVAHRPRIRRRFRAAAAHASEKVERAATTPASGSSEPNLWLWTCCSHSQSGGFINEWIDQGPEVGAGYHLKVWRTARSQPPTPAAAFLRGGASAFRRHIGRKGSRHLPGWSSSRAAVNLIIASGIIHPSTSTSAAELGGEDGTVIGAAPSAANCITCCSYFIAMSSSTRSMERRAGAAPHLAQQIPHVARACRA